MSAPRIRPRMVSSLGFMGPILRRDRVCDQHHWMSNVVGREVIDARVPGYTQISLDEAHAHGERVRLRRFMHGDAGEHLPADFERGQAVGRSFVHIGPEQLGSRISWKY